MKSSPKEFLKRVSEYAEYIKSHAEPSTLESFGQMEELTFILGVFINYWKIKKLPLSRKQAEFKTLFYDVLYKFSHEKYSALLAYPEVQFLFSQVLISRYIKNFIARYPTLRNEPDRYEEWIERIMGEIQVIKSSLAI